MDAKFRNFKELSSLSSPKITRNILRNEPLKILSKAGTVRLSGTSGRISITLMIAGVLSLVISVFLNSQILAFVGLGLTFWGALFIFITPTRHVEASLLGSTAIAYYNTVDRMLANLKYSGKAHYIPSYPRYASIPDHLSSLKDRVVFIPAQDATETPSIEGIAEGRFIVKKPEGILITPPGVGLLEQLEKRKLKLDLNEPRNRLEKMIFTQESLKELCEILPRLILDNLNLAKEIELTPQDPQINLRIIDSAYRNLYSSESTQKSLSLLGCPLVSAIACILADALGKRVTIEKFESSRGGVEIQVSYRIVQG